MSEGRKPRRRRAQPSRSFQQSERVHFALHSLNTFQVAILITNTQFGVGIFNLPRVVVEAAGHDGWMSVLLAGVIVQVALILMVILLRRFEHLDLYGICRRIFGKWIGNALGLLFALYCVAVAAVVSRTYVEVVQSWLFPTTSTNVFYLLILIPCTYAATGGIRVLGRFGTAILLGTIWIAFLLIVPARDIQLNYYLPLFEAPLLDIAKGSWNVSASVVGFELLLLIYPFIQKKQKTLMAVSSGSWLTITLYLSTVLVAIGFYSTEQLITIMSPTLHMAQIVELPMIERVEHIEIATWSFMIVITVSTYLWAAGRYLHKLTKMKEATGVYCCVPLLLWIGLIPQDMYLLDQFEKLLGTIGSSVSLCFAPLLLVLSLVLRKKGAGSEGFDQPQDKEVNAS